MSNLRQTALLSAALMMSGILIAPVPASAETNQTLASPILQAGDPISTAFQPKPTLMKMRFDYAVLDEALSDVVLDFGPSDRAIAPRPQPEVGTRFVRGHTSPLRKEGSRIAYEFLNKDYKNSLSEYRRDLESLGSQYPLTSMHKDEQLAYWLNLHNVAMIEQIAQNYPITRPSQIKVEIDGIAYPLNDAKFLTVNGIKLSPRDIREKIVYSNWDKREVIYGFYRGDIGSPLLPRWAYTRDTVWQLLGNNAEDFVNSLRGFTQRGETLRVSAIYEEARPYFFTNWEADLTAHMMLYARPEVAEDIEKGRTIRIASYEDTIGDLTAGRGNSALGGATDGTGAISYDMARLIDEVVTKKRNLRARGLLGRSGRGTVTIIDIDTSSDGEAGDTDSELIQMDTPTE